MTLKQMEDEIGGLSNTSKMPWLSWSISARKCITGSKLAKKEGTVCNKCYALKGRYVFPKVQNALYRRLDAFNKLGVRWQDKMIALLLAKHKKTKDKVSYFRWFDSGDLQSQYMLMRICLIAEATPNIMHWLPTKEYKMIRDYIDSEDMPKIPPNLFIKISMPNIGQEVVKTINHPQVSYTTVGANNTEYQCPASTQGNKCGDCRKCWSSMNINYPLH